MQENGLNISDSEIFRKIPKKPETTGPAKEVFTQRDKPFLAFLIRAFGTKYFNFRELNQKIKSRIGGLPTSTLTDRLNRLVAAKLLERLEDSGFSRSTQYRVIVAGK